MGIGTIVKFAKRIIEKAISVKLLKNVIDKAKKAKLLKGVIVVVILNNIRQEMMCNMLLKQVNYPALMLYFVIIARSQHSNIIIGTAMTQSIVLMLFRLVENATKGYIILLKLPDYFKSYTKF